MILSNQGPITFSWNEQGALQSQRGSGGLVTALAGLAQNVEAPWIVSANSEEDRDWGAENIPGDRDTSTSADFELETPQAVHPWLDEYLAVFLTKS